jgi:predicted permease
VAAALLARSLSAAQSADVGFRPAGLAVVSMDLEMLRYEEERARQFLDQAVDRVRAIPGVESVALSDRVPFSLNFSNFTVFVPGHHGPADRGTPLLGTRVSSDYFATLGVPILQGRGFTGTDRPDTTAVAVINETMARRYWPDESPLGKRIHLLRFDGPAYEIVGVAADHRVRTVGEIPGPYIHFARSQRPGTYAVMSARTGGDAAALLSQLRRELLAMEPNLVFMDNQTMEAQVAATLFPLRAGAWIVAGVGLVAMLLAAVGLYGVIAYSVTRRTREIGIRMALGAKPSGVVGLVMRQGLIVAGAGVVVGCLLAAGAVRAIGGMLYGVGIGDPVAWIAAAGVLLAVSVVANVLPARRAARLDPSVALRTE